MRLFSQVHIGNFFDLILIISSPSEAPKVAFIQCPRIQEIWLLRQKRLHELLYTFIEWIVNTIHDTQPNFDPFLNLEVKREEAAYKRKEFVSYFGESCFKREIVRKMGNSWRICRTAWDSMHEENILVYLMISKLLY